MASKRHQRRVQERKNREKQDRQCTGKITYGSERSAMLSARAISLRRGVDLRPYACPQCSTKDEIKYHIGHDVSLKGDRSGDMVRQGAV